MEIYYEDLKPYTVEIKRAFWFFFFMWLLEEVGPISQKKAKLI